MLSNVNLLIVFCQPLWTLFNRIWVFVMFHCHWDSINQMWKIPKDSTIQTPLQSNNFLMHQVKLRIALPPLSMALYSDNSAHWPSNLCPFYYTMFGSTEYEYHAVHIQWTQAIQLFGWKFCWIAHSIFLLYYGSGLNSHSTPPPMNWLFNPSCNRKKIAPFYPYLTPLLHCNFYQT